MKNTMKKGSASNSIRYINDTKAAVTKSFAKKAQVFGTEEFKLWREYLAYYPKAQMYTKDNRKNPNKKNITKHMTYENMRLFISLQDDGKTVMVEFEKQIQLSKIKENPYRAVLAWFLEKYENVNDYKAFYEKLKEKEENEKKANLYKAFKEDYEIENDEEEADE